MQHNYPLGPVPSEHLTPKRVQAMGAMNAINPTIHLSQPTMEQNIIGMNNALAKRQKMLKTF